MINYYLLTKPGILLGNLITVIAGFLLASKGSIDPILLAATLLGITLIMASACVFNNYIDRDLDKKMERTKSRALVNGLITERNALIYGTLLALGGGATLIVFTNVLTFFIAAAGFCVYVVLYSMWKSHTIYGTAIGSIAGAVPPVVGYCAVRGEFDAAAFILFAMLVLWQMPHFFSIAILNLSDYTKAEIPLLPIKKGLFTTKIHMLFYISAFIPAALMLYLLGYTSDLYFIMVLAFGLTWLALCVKGFDQKTDDRKWSGQMFRLSLFVIVAICFAIPY